MHLFSVSTAIPVFALAVVLVNSNLSLALSDFSARIVAFAYTGWDISLSGLLPPGRSSRFCSFALSWSCLHSQLIWISMILTLNSRSNCLLSFAVWALLLAGIGFPLLLTWEVVGWISFRLISHWLSRAATSKQGLLALNANRVGDVALLAWLAMGICTSSISMFAFWFSVCCMLMC